MSRRCSAATSAGSSSSLRDVRNRHRIHQVSEQSYSPSPGAGTESNAFDSPDGHGGRPCLPSLLNGVGGVGKSEPVQQIVYHYHGPVSNYYAPNESNSINISHNSISNSDDVFSHLEKIQERHHHYPLTRRDWYEMKPMQLHQSRPGYPSTDSSSLPTSSGVFLDPNTSQSANETLPLYGSTMQTDDCQPTLHNDASSSSTFRPPVRSNRKVIQELRANSTKCDVVIKPSVSGEPWEKRHALEKSDSDHPSFLHHQPESNIPNPYSPFRQRPTDKVPVPCHQSIKKCGGNCSKPFHPDSKIFAPKPFIRDPAAVHQDEIEMCVLSPGSDTNSLYGHHALHPQFPESSINGQEVNRTRTSRNAISKPAKRPKAPGFLKSMGKFVIKLLGIKQ